MYVLYFAILVNYNPIQFHHTVKAEVPKILQLYGVPGIQ